MENTFAQENEKKKHARILLLRPWNLNPLDIHFGVYIMFSVLKHRVLNGIACYRVPTHLQLQKSCFNIMLEFLL